MENYHSAFISRLFLGPWNKYRERKPLFTCFWNSASHWKINEAGATISVAVDGIKLSEN